MTSRTPLALPLAALAGFLVLLALVIAGWPPLVSVDTAVSEAFRGYGGSRPGLVAVIRIGTDVAATVPFLVSAAVATLLFALRGERAAAALCALVGTLIPVLWSVLHWVLYRPRPENGFVVVDSNGFPSGHTAHATAAALVAVLLLWPRLTRPGRAVLVGLAAMFAVAVAMTRVALLAHWPVDVLGGWLLALAVVPLSAAAVRRRFGESAGVDPRSTGYVEQREGNRD